MSRHGVCHTSVPYGDWCLYPAACSIWSNDAIILSVEDASVLGCDTVLLGE